MIELKHVTKVYEAGENQVFGVRELDLEIGDGEFVVVVGPSGCGKSTLLNVIGGIDTVTEGTVMVDGEDISRLGDGALTAFRRRKVGFVFQSYNLVQTLTASENVQLALRLRGVQGPGVRKEAERYLGMVGVEELADRFPSEMSGGQQQRVAIARALAKESSLLLADEPTGSVDRESGHRVVSTLREAAKTTGGTIIVATHDLSITKAADRVIKLVDGRVAEDTRPERDVSGGGSE
jgi:putative ABC transport system ATP-binding protein